MLKYREGQSASFPPEIRIHLVAARYGQSPDAVRAWPADDFVRACSLMEITG